MTVSLDALVGALGKRADDPAVEALLGELGLAERAPNVKDGVSTSLEAPKHGVALFFRSARHLRKTEAFKNLPPETAVVSEVVFRVRGFGGGPGYSGKLPHDLDFSLTRTEVRERLGPPTTSGMMGLTDRWESGDRYLTLAFGNGDKLGRVTCGLIWTL